MLRRFRTQLQALVNKGMIEDFKIGIVDSNKNTTNFNFAFVPKKPMERITFNSKIDPSLLSK
jgi:hypothetical protein